MPSPELLALLRCPACVRNGPDAGRLVLFRDSWLICQDEGCGRKYPIDDDIPIMLVEEGDKYVNVPVEELPEPGSH